MIKSKFLVLASAVSVGVLAGCQSVESQRINLYSYSPVVDIEGDGGSREEFYADLDACRTLGLKAQAQYEEQRTKEQERAAQQAVIGALAGAVIGSAIGQNSDSLHSGRTATAGAIYGGAIGSAAGAEQTDHSRIIAKFGPTKIVDKCMTRRGWHILSDTGLGGG